MQPITFSKLLLFCVFALSTRADDIVDALYNCYRESIFSGDFNVRYDQRWVTPEIREILLKRARELQYDKDRKVSEEAHTFLIWLGDEATLQDCMKKHLANPNVGLYGGEAILPYLAEDIYNGDQSRVPRGGANFTSVMDDSLSEMYDIIRHYKTFPEATREWADRTEHLARDDRGPMSAGNQLMRLWWEHNKDAVNSRQYDKAIWIPSKELQDSIIKQFPKPKPDEGPVPGIEAPLEPERA